MKILIAPNAFKGNLTALQIANVLSDFFKKRNFATESFPIADGGDGTLEVFLHVFGGKKVRSNVLNPLARKIQAEWGLNNEMAIIEMSNASGIKLLQETELDPWMASSYGTGRLIKEAIEKGATRILLGIGGSATVDGGIGMMSALGAKFFDSKSKQLGDQLSIKEFVEVDFSDAQKLLSGIEIVVLSDVDNPLLGENGAAAIFGPQKGASPEMVKKLENRLQQWSSLITAKTGKDRSNENGAGAAGGIGYALASISNAEIVNGFQYLAEKSDLQKKVQDCDVVITGEGRIDGQTLSGKGPGEVAKLAKKHEKICIGICGDVDASQQYQPLFDKVFSFVDENTSKEYAMAHSEELLLKTAKSIENYLKTNL